MMPQQQLALRFCSSCRGSCRILASPAPQTVVTVVTEASATDWATIRFCALAENSNYGCRAGPGQVLIELNWRAGDAASYLSEGGGGERKRGEEVEQCCHLWAHWQYIEVFVIFWKNWQTMKVAKSTRIPTSLGKWHHSESQIGKKANWMWICSILGVNWNYDTYYNLDSLLI